MTIKLKKEISLVYTLITPAKNEEMYIEKTIQSVIAQTVLPHKWVIVSDGSTDRTDEIVSKYSTQNSWIEFVRIPERTDRQFAAKVHAFNAGYEQLKDVDYDIIGNLDADITFDKEYFEFVLTQFKNMPNLGVGGTPFIEDSFESYQHKYANFDHVSGACQMFRRECFEEIGGYVPVKGGGIDWIAVTSARMKGWKTRTFPEKKCFHHREMGTGRSNLYLALFRHGKEDYYLGGHPLWQLFRSFFQMTQKPYIIGGFLFLAGYIWAFLTRVKSPLSKELIAFHRGEQMDRLRNHFSKFFRLKNK